jgi:hypothetical protein
LPVQQRQGALQLVGLACEGLSQPGGGDGSVVVQEQVERPGEQRVLERGAATEVWEVVLAGHGSFPLLLVASVLNRLAVELGFAAVHEGSADRRMTNR